MRTDNQNKLHPLLLLSILVIAVYIRAKGIWFGYPLPVHSDESKLVKTALNMLSTGDLNPHFFNYPTLHIYLQALIYKVITLGSQALFSLSATDIPVIWFYIVGRLFNVLLSILTILITYELGRRLISSFAGLISAWFITFSFLHVSNSFTITVDASVAFWLSLATLMAVLIYTKEKKFAYYLLGGVFVGFAVSSKYTAFVGVVPILIAHYKQSRNKRDWIDKNIITVLLVIPIAFFITTPYAILDYKTFLGALKYEAKHYSTGHPGCEADGSTSFYLYGNYLLRNGYGLFPTLFSVIGLIWLLRKDLWKAAILLSNPLFLFLLVGKYKVFFPRNIVALVPFLSLFSGFFIVTAYEWLTEKIFNLRKPKRMMLSANTLLIVVLIGSVYMPTIKTIKYINNITLPDTRWVSIEWIKQNIARGSNIGREHYTPPLEEFTKSFKVVYLGYFAVAAKQEDVQRLDYMIVSTGDYARFMRSPEKYPKEQKAYVAFFDTHELVHEFTPDSKTLGGPKVSIYKIRRRLHQD
jgi:4-amino-4-deoxy-L-arabinose transferase-like glycosyltransferase